MVVRHCRNLVTTYLMWREQVGSVLCHGVLHREVLVLEWRLLDTQFSETGTSKHFPKAELTVWLSRVV